MTSAIDGLVSGLDTTSIINSLMKIEAQPQTIIKTKQSTSQSMVSALQSFNTKLSSLAEAATKASTASSWDAYSATSSSTSVTTSAGATAQPGSVTFTVDQVATSQVSVSGVYADDSSLLTDTPPQLTVRKADGGLVTIAPTSGSLADITTAINAATDAGIRATAVQVSGGGAAQYRIQFTGTTTGLDGAFSVYKGDAATVQAAIDANDGSAAALQIDTNPYQAAQNAKVTLWKGNVGLEQSVEQSSNTFENLMTGVSVTVSKLTAVGDDPVTVSVARNTSAASTLASDLVNNLNTVLSEITSRTATTTSTDSTGRTTITGGLFTGDSLVRDLQQALTTAGSQSSTGISPATVGISIDKDGVFSFDAAAFATAMANDPGGVQALVSSLGTGLATVAGSASDPHHRHRDAEDHGAAGPDQGLRRPDRRLGQPARDAPEPAAEDLLRPRGRPVEPAVPVELALEPARAP